MKGHGNAMKSIIRGMGYISYFCLVLMMLLVMSDPIMRYFAGSPVYWSNEVSTLLMVVMAYTGLGVAFTKGHHVRITLIFNKLPMRTREVLWIIISLLTMGYIVVLGFSVMRRAIFSFMDGRVTQTAELPYYPWEMLVVIGLVGFFLAVLLFIIKELPKVWDLRRQDDDYNKTIKV
jgi:C4-dicarboxylate transporter, DctQ subunit